MHPILFSLWGISVPAYGFFVATAHLMGIWAVVCLVKKEKRPLEPYAELILAVMVGGLLGARVGYILEYPDEFVQVSDYWNLNRGGLSFFAGLMLGFPAYLLVLKIRKLPIWETSDQMVPILPICLALVRLGCLAAGCCHGAETSVPWGITIEGKLLHPTQIYEILFLMILGIFLWKMRTKSPKPGIAATGFLLAYGFFRFATNPLRGDLVIHTNWPTSLAQIFAISLILISLPIFLWRLKKPKFPNRDFQKV